MIHFVGEMIGLFILFAKLISSKYYPQISMIPTGLIPIDIIKVPLY